jgi:hypothetical protein
VLQLLFSQWLHLRTLDLGRNPKLDRISAEAWPVVVSAL